MNSLGDNLGQNLVKGGLGQGADFIVAAVLNRVRHIADGGFEAKRLALGGGGFSEFGRSDEHARQTAPF